LSGLGGKSRKEGHKHHPATLRTAISNEPMGLKVETRLEKEKADSLKTKKRRKVLTEQIGRFNLGTQFFCLYTSVDGQRGCFGGTDELPRQTARENISYMTQALPSGGDSKSGSSQLQKMVPAETGRIEVYTKITRGLDKKTTRRGGENIVKGNSREKRDKKISARSSSRLKGFVKGVYNNSKNPAWKGFMERPGHRRKTSGPKAVKQPTKNSASSQKNR